MTSSKHLVDGKYSIKDLVDLEELRALFQSFTDATGFTIGFLSAPELEILIATGWRDICTKYHRRCPLAATRCKTSNTRLVRQLKRPDQVVIEACSNGLVDCAIPIIIKGKKIAILATGQVLLKPPDLGYFKKQAKLFRCNEAAYLRALAEVPVISRKKLKQATRFLGELAHMVIRMGYAGVEQKERFVEHKLEEEREREVSLRFKAVFDSTFQFIALLKPDGKVLEVNRSALKFGGLTMQDVRDKSFWNCHWWTLSRQTRQKLRKSIAVAARGKFIRYSVEVLGKKGSTITIDFSLKAVKDEKGRVFLLTAEGRDITDRKRAEAKLSQREAYLSAIFENQPGMTWLKDKNSRFLAVNKAFAKMAGRKNPEEVEGKTDLDFWPSGLAHKYRADDRRVMTKREHLEVEELISEKGVARWHETFKTPVFDASGKVIGTTGYARDITERKRSEEALKRSELEKQMVLKNIPDLVVYQDAKNRIVWANSSTAKAFGKKPEELEGSICYKAFHGLSRPCAGCPVNKSKKTGFVEHAEMTSLDGRHWMISGSPVKDASGAVVGIVEVAVNITERKQAEEALREHRRQLLQVIDTVPHMIFAKDAKGRFLLVNRALAEAYQKEPKDLIGVRRQDIHRVAKEMEQFLIGDREVLNSGRPLLVPNEPFTDAQGRKHILQTIRIPFHLAGVKETCLLGVSVDVTEQRKVEEFRNEIVRTVSHELRTPLSIEKEGISLLMDEMLGPINVEQKEILGTVMRSIDRLARMITSLLDISSIETGKIQLSHKMTDLGDLVKDAVFEFKKRASEKGIDLSVKLPGRAAQVLVDPDKITQVLSNLVDNAIKFTEKGSVEISLNILKEAVECEVRDTGIGIAPENIAKAFEKFQQFSRTAGPGEKGFGLGLSIVKGIIEMHGGRTRLKSKLGKGTQVSFSLPLYHKERAA